MKPLFTWFGKLLYWTLYVPHSVYLHGKPRARVFVVCGDEVLMVKDFIGNGRWNIPGGGIHKGELPSEAAVRELHEETGVQVAIHDLRFLAEDHYTSHGKSFYTVYTARLNDKPPLRRKSLEIIDAQWHKLNTLADDPLAGDDVKIAAKALEVLALI